MAALMDTLLATSTFHVEIDQVTIASFKKVSGMESESEIIEYKEVAKGQVISRKRAGQIKYADIELAKCIDADTYLWEWRRLVEQGDMEAARRNGSIVALDSTLQEVARWNFFNGWISKWTGAEFDAEANEVALETVTIAHEKVERVK
jgi:phage tail-like protein